MTVRKRATCYWCAHSFEPNSKYGPVPRWCSDNCKTTLFRKKKRRREHRCPDCGTRLVLPGKSYCRWCALCRKVSKERVGGTVQGDMPCDMCGRVFNSAKGGRYCDLVCRNAAKLQRKRVGYDPWASCRLCGDRYIAAKRVRGSDGYRYCSDACLESALRTASLAKAVARRRSFLNAHAVRKDEWAQCGCGEPVNTRHGRTWCSAACRNAQHINGLLWQRRCECGADYMPQNSRQRFCSSKCAKQSRKFKVYRATRLRIYRRDRWVCQLCHERVSESLTRSNPMDGMAASLDHIIPRSDGGSDDPANLQLAHRRCNWEKSTDAVGSQLRLVG